jgi:hypothetical protein
LISNTESELSYGALSARRGKQHTENGDYAMA